MALVVGTDTLATVAEADTRIAEFYPHDTAWAALDTTAKKESCLRAATRAVCDGFVWHGYRTDRTQDLDFPREGLWDRDGQYVLPGNVIPDEVKWAVIEQARVTAAKDRQKDDVIETRDIRQSGNVQFSGRGGRKVLSDLCWELIPSHWYSAERRRPRPGEAVTIMDVHRG